MSDMKPAPVKLNLDGKDYGLRMTLNVIDDIQDHFDIPIAGLADLLQDEKQQIKTIRYLLTAMINEDIDCQNDEMSTTGKERLLHVDERWVGRHIDGTNINGLIEKIYGTVGTSLPEADEDADPQMGSPNP